MGFGLWIDRENGLAWAQGTHEYRPMGAAVISSTDQFRHRDFRQARKRPRTLQNSFAGKIGRIIEPVIKPLGFDWQIGIGILSSLDRKSVV